ncbi:MULTISPECIES: hypothetical protein [unclassified Bradyrhizobium]|uniref:hypothetical protein n=1 Tax=unclassified Bradyrhizobium TaxID=2631580 RepID=UPI00291643CB|nr:MULTISPECIES: hypothetical protein [unclassified Bradyrhizobium]
MTQKSAAEKSAAAQATAIVEAWKLAHGLPYFLLPEACHDLTERIERALVSDEWNKKDAPRQPAKSRDAR